ncbi:uncharacterized protein [Canis lupus baileyi]|uniref:uncharacterized protein LOC106559282 isoform X5 n=1 Tax=Canis lupus familiaris TaxID=9615 RepID=UPI000BAA19C7|nr:uncharacterized protein LOC106559282 isoform X5 [Canis lupus familiaris]XP_022278628.1 uncharacterized protein LOC106559282 isoform X5 [Canis lupus familiaris]XP_022278629.1 uncharacterized protein LOC106559282 isoform X5 [Canis lupus familiaris]XP_025296142.1 uncharacterized protein LOC112655311 isoform X6 [Canis lupus dingo]XP_025296143.1 uncharacterized protein LOC112655311 isoform X6 [Canis lupus dingo]XP_025296144.1 uncharacterized protein LOC112655311 isoform X6 [Canis lupus dingo]XP|eukprot:XP_022278627.1 uncharacterized protein LOC106559282 isoform X5 [Canis lupus familiaris]
MEAGTKGPSAGSQAPALRCACALALVCLALLLLLRPRGALGEALQPQQPPGPRAADWLSNFAHFNKYLEKLFNSSSKSKDTKKSKNVKNPKKAANTTRTPPANTTKPLPANATKPPRQTTGKPQPPPSSQGPRGEEQVVLPLPPGPSQPVTPAMSRAEMAGAHRGPVPEKLDVRMALS